jgi:hypothetical protein
MPKSRIQLTALVLIQLAALLYPLGSAAKQATQEKTQDQRKTSQPYTDDRSIFETPGRAERLQIDRVMGILGRDFGEISS